MKIFNEFPAAVSVPVVSVVFAILIALVLIRPRKTTAASAALDLFNSNAKLLPAQTTPDRMGLKDWVSTMVLQANLSETTAYFLLRNEQAFVLSVSDGIPSIKLRDGASLK